MREWLAQSLPLYSYFTLHQPDGVDGSQRLDAFQLLSAPATLILPPTYDRMSTAEMKKTTWTVQRLGVWNGSAIGLEPAEIEAFQVEDSSKTDLVALLQCDPEMRHTIKLWDMRPSDAQGFMNLNSPREPVPNISIDDKHFPILGLLDAVHFQDWIGVNRKVVHTARSGKLFCFDGSHNRAYLRCDRCSNYCFL
jgi:hypothetical protein